VGFKMMPIIQQSSSARSEKKKKVFQQVSNLQKLAHTEFECRESAPTRHYGSIVHTVLDSQLQWALPVDYVP
jgi:hypothetical protein